MKRRAPWNLVWQFGDDQIADCGCPEYPVVMTPHESKFADVEIPDVKALPQDIMLRCARVHVILEEKVEHRLQPVLRQLAGCLIFFRAQGIQPLTDHIVIDLRLDHESIGGLASQHRVEAFPGRNSHLVITAGNGRCARDTVDIAPLDNPAYDKGHLGITG
ncbi:hypothetical protein ACOI1H_22995 [Loktanella sp. DJP18]|uniref:hypothetical protein n=1 Tax=Loktanella sp. DJP18 TaxID=3409788 RepID=UPI003BB6E627